MTATSLLKEKKPALPSYGAPPKDLKERKGAIGNFFLSAEFKPVLSDEFLYTYKDQQPNWGPIGYVTYKRTYARPMYASDLGIEISGDITEDTVIRTEEYWETCARVINGLWHIIRVHAARKCIDFSEKVAQRKAQKMFERMWAFKWLPPGRGLWMMGTSFMYIRGSSALNNCAFCSTKDITKDGSEPFVWAMDMSMLGAGVGFDTRGAGSITFQEPVITEDSYLIEDSREGWVDSVGTVLDAFFKGSILPIFDYSAIRPKGSPIRGFGGVAEGPSSLITCHKNLTSFLTARIGKQITQSDIVDIFNEIGACVVSGNVRRSAQIALGDPNDREYLKLKHHPDQHPNCWNSNNSVFAEVGMDYSEIAELIKTRGEPGILWMDNIKAYGRMDDPKNQLDKNALGTNPCSEISLHDREMCTLVETFPSMHSDQNDFFETLKQSYLYAKAVTLVPSHNKKTNKVMGKNSRIGCSMSGIQQARTKFGTRPFLDMVSAGYTYLRERDNNYSDWLQVRHSIKITAVKPSGTVSLLPGVSPGIHYPIERTYLRRIRFAANNTMVSVLKDAGYRVYPAPEQPDSTVVVDFPVMEKHVGRIEREVSIWEQLEFCAAIQALWADNQVSITVKFDPLAPNITEDIARALELYENRLKSVSFLPISATDAGYKAAPYQAIEADQYVLEILPLESYSFNKEIVDDMHQESCDNGVCPVR